MVFLCNHIFDTVKTRFRKMNCSVAQALEVLGDWRTLLVVREAFFGTRRFADFERNLDISKNILSERLAHLVKHGVLARIDAGTHGKRYEYELTKMGKDLATVMTALRQWADRWLLPGKEPLIAVDARTGKPIPRLRIIDERGQPIAPQDLLLLPGPGASKADLRRFRAASDNLR